MDKYVKHNQLLNDDCLEEIIEHLPLKDIIIASDVSQQFRRVAQEVVKTKRSRIRLKDIYPETTLPCSCCEHFFKHSEAF